MSTDATCAHEKIVEIPPDLNARADEIISHYPVSKRSASLPLCYLWQEYFHYISDQGVRWIAEKLELQPVHILEVVTFYPMFRQHPVGRIQFTVCRTLSCALSGSAETCAYLKKRCGITEEDAHGVGVSPDGKYSVEFVECLAACGTGPVVMVNDDFYEQVDTAKADDLLKKYA